MAAGIFIFTGMYTRNLTLFETFVISPEIRTNLESHSICFDFWWFGVFSSHCIYCIFSIVIFFTLLESSDLRKECTIKVEKIKQKVSKWKTFFIKLVGKNCPKCKYFFPHQQKMAGFQISVKNWGKFHESLFQILSSLPLSLFGKLFWMILELYNLLVRT